MYEISNYVCFAYLFNPCTILNCVAMTSTVFSNFFLALLFYFITSRKLLYTILVLAIETVRSFYPVVLIAPMVLIFSESSKRSACRIVLFFVVFTAGVYQLNYVLIGSWTFIDGTLGFMLVVKKKISVNLLNYIDFFTVICNLTWDCFGIFSRKCLTTSEQCSL